ncbi:hypothetical protein GP486_004968 [Trichoglossum hirsutum]|uniref:RNA-dependent RNA polymerase n=1 Tax=Trichoglossum hirsutum TaxID=265104 RepID=A0A9P8LA22_9PEZI|nr:hypothetical protein GP486_004968 [Trichoglossum hirsutum]
MDTPTTPRRSDKELDGFVQALNSKWCLSLPARNSPSPKTDPQTDEKCFRYIRLLFFKDRLALDRVVQKFENDAENFAPLNGWVRKPNQDQDTPPKSSVASRDTFPKKADIPWSNHIYLTQRLLEVLQPEAETVRARLRSTPETIASRVYTTTMATTIRDGPATPGQADRGTILYQRKEPRSRGVTVATKQVKIDHYFSPTHSHNRRHSVGGDDRNGKRKSHLGERQGHDSENEEYFTPRESPPSPPSPQSPSEAYESRRRIKTRRIGVRPSFGETHDWAPVHVPPSPPEEVRETPISPILSRKRSSLDLAVTRHQKSPRPRPDERSHGPRKMNTHVTLESPSMPLCQLGDPEVPLFPPVPSADTSFRTNASTSFSTSIFSYAPSDGEVATSANTSFMSGFGDTSELPHGPTATDTSHNGGSGMALGAGDRTASFTEALNAFNRTEVSSTARGLEDRLFKYSPFGKSQSDPPSIVILKQCGIPMSELATNIPSVIGGYNDMWTWFQQVLQPRGKNLPERGNDKAWELADKKDFLEGVVNWLVKGNHEFLGREWKAFYLKMNKGKAKLGAEKDPTSKWSVYFFAVDGCDFVEGTNPPAKGEPVEIHSRMSLREMLEWYMPFEPNKDITCCKSFARLAFGSTLVFRPEEVIRIKDTFSNAGEGKVMNDGCARISRPAACAIAEKLCLDGSTPSVFQGRIAGAKGLWMVDPSRSPRSNTHGDRGYWIEITDSQWKFEGHPTDLHLPDDDRITFEVNAWSKPLRAASLNFQLLPILECQGVPRQIIEKYSRDDLESKVSGLMESLEDPVAFRKWIHDNGDSIEERVKNQGVQFQGGVPLSTSERISWFLESGFNVGGCAYLRELARSEVKKYCDSLKNKVHFEVGQSTYAYCVADPLGVLEEGEVHFGFSTTFKDPRSGFQDTLLHDIDVLVARLPALLPSDVQKVWVCWDSEFVADFKNAPLPEAKPLSEQLEYYGIKQDMLKLTSLPSNPDERTFQFIRHGFRVNLEESLLGICTNFHEKFCYHHGSIESPEAIALAVLLGLLVDREKQGYVFTDEEWQRFRSKISRPMLPRPAYREGDKSRQTEHIIDRVLFRVAYPIIEKVLEDFQGRFGDNPLWDSDLAKLWKQEGDAAGRDVRITDQEDGAARRDGRVLDQEDEAAGRNVKVRKVLSQLARDVDAVWDYWVARSKEDSDFPARVWQAHDRFQRILPMEVDHPLVDRWREDAMRNANSHWRLLRASAAYYRHHKGNLVWWLAGKELGQLKALASCEFHMVVKPIHASYIPDKSYVRRVRMSRVQGMDAEAESVMGDEEIEGETDDFGSSVFGYDDWLDEAL